MHFATLLTLLAAGVQQAVAAPMEMLAPVERSHVQAMRVREAQKVESRGALSCGSTPHLSATGCQTLSKLGFVSAGANECSSTANSAWVGADGPYSANFNNTSPDEVVLVVWNQQFGYASSFVQNQQPRLTVSIPAGSSKTISFAEGASGAWSGIYPDTALANGQVSNSWGEYCASGPWSTVDVSREVNMNGNAMSITTPGGCTSNMEQCVFVCNGGASTCGTAGSYTLQSCSGTGAASGTSYGQPSGGCQGWASGQTLQVELGA